MLMNLKTILQKILPKKSKNTDLPKATSKLSGHDLKLAFTDFFCDGLSSSSSTARIHYFMNKYQFKKLDKKFGDPMNYYQATLDEVRSCILIELEEEDVGQMQPNNMQDCLAPDKIIKNFPDFFNESNKHLTLKYLGIQHKLKTVKIGGTLYYRCSMEEIEESIAKSKKELSSLVSLRELHSYFKNDIKKEALRRVLSQNGFKPKILFGKAFFELSTIQAVKDILHAKKTPTDDVEPTKPNTNELTEELTGYTSEDFQREYVSDVKILEIFKISKRTLYRTIKKNDLSYIKIGAFKYFKKDNLFRALEQKPKVEKKSKTNQKSPPKTNPSFFNEAVVPSSASKLIDFDCGDEMDYIDCCYFLKTTRCTFNKLREEFSIKPLSIDKKGRFFYKKSDIEQLLLNLIECKMNLEKGRTMLWASSSHFFSWSQMTLLQAIQHHKSIDVPLSVSREYRDKIENPIKDSTPKKSTEGLIFKGANQNKLEQATMLDKPKVNLYSHNYDWVYHNDKPMNGFALKHISEDRTLCTFSKGDQSIKIKTSFLSKKNQSDLLKDFS